MEEVEAVIGEFVANAQEVLGRAITEYERLAEENRNLREALNFSTSLQVCAVRNALLDLISALVGEPDERLLRCSAEGLKKAFPEWTEKIDLPPLQYPKQ